MFSIHSGNKVVFRKNQSLPTLSLKKSASFKIKLMGFLLFSPPLTLRSTSLPAKQKNFNSINENEKETTRNNYHLQSPELCEALENYPEKIFRKEIGRPKQGAQGDVKFEMLVTPKGKRKMEAVKKTGGATIKKEIAIFNAISQHKLFNTVKNFFSVPFFSKENNQTCFFYTHLQPQGSLERYVDYIHKHLANTLTLSYLFKQFWQLVIALNFLHNQSFTDKNGVLHHGIVHGDIKPDNILLNTKGDFVLSDFGCAHFSDQPIQELGMVLYVAPELHHSVEIYHRKAHEAIDKTDIWALGVLLLYLLTKQYPIDLVPIHENDVTCEMKKVASTGYVLYDSLHETSNKNQKPNFLCNNLPSQHLRKKWADHYTQSSLCQEAKIAKKAFDDLLEHPAMKNGADPFRVKLLKNIALIMLLPIEERPSAKELADKMGKLAHYFRCDKESYIDFIELMFIEVQPIRVAEKPSCSYRTF